jgi:hypothetical protein
MADLVCKDWNTSGSPSSGHAFCSAKARFCTVTHFANSDLANTGNHLQQRRGCDAMRTRVVHQKGR